MIYITRGNKARVETIESGKTMVEREGHHNVPGNTVYRDASGREDSIAILFQGRVSPFGDSQKQESLEQLCCTIVATSFLGGRMDIDSAAGRFLRQLIKNAIPVGVLILMAFVGLSMLFQGGA